jgi:hypothetical protein
MRKHLFSFIAAVGVLFAGAGTAWADDAVVVKLEREVTTENVINGIEYSSSSDLITIASSIGSSVKTMNQSKDVYYLGTKRSFLTDNVSPVVFRNDNVVNTTSYNDNCYVGYTLDIDATKRFKLSQLDVAAAFGYQNFKYGISIIDEYGNEKYSSRNKTVGSNYNSSAVNDTLSATISNVYLTGKCTVKFNYCMTSNNTTKYFTPIKLQLTGELVAAATQSESPVIKLGNYDKTTQTYSLTITSTDGSDIYYSLNNAAAVKYDGNALTVAPGDKIVAHCEKTGLQNSADETLEVPSFVTYTETTGAGTDKTPLVGISYTINGAETGNEKYIAGAGSNGYETYIKMRTAQTAGSVTGFRIAVNKGYTILKIEGNGYANAGSVTTTGDDGNSTKTPVYGDIQIKGVYVDDGKNTLTDETIVTLPKSSDSKTR